MSTLALPLAFWSPGPGEMLVIGVIALLLYGGDLPRVARSWGKTLTEFRRGLSGIQDEINDAIYAEPEVAPPKLEYHPEFHNDDADPTATSSEGALQASADDSQAGDSEFTAELTDDFQDRAVAESAEAAAAQPPPVNEAKDAPPD